MLHNVYPPRELTRDENRRTCTNEARAPVLCRSNLDVRHPSGRRNLYAGSRVRHVCARGRRARSLSSSRAPALRSRSRGQKSARQTTLSLSSKKKSASKFKIFPCNFNSNLKSQMRTFWPSVSSARRRGPAAASAAPAAGRFPAALRERRGRRLDKRARYSPRTTRHGEPAADDGLLRFILFCLRDTSASGGTPHSTPQALIRPRSDIGRSDRTRPSCQHAELQQQRKCGLASRRQPPCCQEVGGR